MKRPLLTLLCGACVAVFQAHGAALSAVSEDAPVPGGTAAFAHALGIDPVPDRGRFLFEITRLVHDTDTRAPIVAAFLQTLGPPTDLVPVPLTAELWSSTVFHRKVARDELVAAIVADRSASWLCHGLLVLDDETLQFFSDHPSLLSRIVERAAAPTFAAFSGSLRVRGNRVIPPGARRSFDTLRAQGGPDDATRLWEAVVGEKVTRPDHFIPQLFELNEGRVAYLYDTIDRLDPPRRAFALGSWIANPAARVDRFKGLATTGVNAFHDWHVRTPPFGRPSYDLGMTFARIDVDENGAPAAPASRGFWSRAFAGRDLPDDGARQTPGLDDDPIDALWLSEAIGPADSRQRADRLDQLAFAQRLVGAAPVPGSRDRADVFVAVRALPRYRMLMLTLERIGVRAPALYATAARGASRLNVAEGHRGFVAHAQVQGALALVARAVGVRTLETARAETLIERLVTIPIGVDGRYAGAIARWMQDDLAAAIPAADTVEAALIAAISGPPSGESDVTPRVSWEGQQYRLDLGAAERQRLRRVRDKQGALPIDVALGIAAASRTLTADGASLDDAQTMAARLAKLAADVPKRSRDDEADNLAAGAGMPADQHEVLRKAVDELTKALKSKDVKRASRAAEPLIDLADDMLAYSLLSFAYAANVGDPDGAVLLADDVSHRHDFGFGVRDADQRVRIAWGLPRQEVIPGVPWHVSGSLLGLDIGLAPLALRRMSFDRVLEAPKLTANERESFARSVSLMNPFLLRDADRDAIADAIERGRRRVAALDATTLDALADDIAMERWRRRAIRWTLAHEPERVPSMVSLTELLVLGGGRPADLSAWGMAMVNASGCVCTQLTPPARWAMLGGRPQLGLTAAIVPDLNLHVATMLKELRLPAALARVILSAAVQDFLDEVKPTDDGDWLTLVRTARTATRERIEDYLAAATAAGPLVPINAAQQP